jgi:hypothetical protein
VELPGRGPAGTPLDRTPHVRVHEEAEACGRDADDRGRQAFDRDGSADDARVAGVPALPVAVREHDHRGAAGLALVGCKESAHGRVHLERLEEAHRRQRCRDPLRLSPTRDGGHDRERGERGQVLERRGLVLVVEEVGARDGEAHLPFPRDPAEHQVVGVRVRQRPEQGALHHPEHGHVPPDSDPQRHEHGQEERRLLWQGPERDSGVPDEVVQDPCTAHVADAFLESLDAAEGHQGAPAGFGRVYAGLYVLPDLHFQVKADLVIELHLCGVLVEQDLPPPPNPAPPAHHAPLLSRGQNRLDRICEQSPPLALDLQGCPALLREPVDLHRPPLVRDALLGLDHAPIPEPIESRIQRSLIHLQDTLAQELNPLRDAPAVQRLEGQRLEDEQIQAALQEIGFGAHSVSSPVTVLSMVGCRQNRFCCRTS